MTTKLLKSTIAMTALFLIVGSFRLVKPKTWK